MCYMIFHLSPANLEGLVERFRNALSVLVNFVKVGILQYIPILLFLSVFMHTSGDHSTDDAFRLCSLYSLRASSLGGVGGGEEERACNDVSGI